MSTSTILLFDTRNSSKSSVVKLFGVDLQFFISPSSIERTYFTYLLLSSILYLLTSHFIFYLILYSICSRVLKQYGSTIQHRYKSGIHMPLTQGNIPEVLVTGRHICLRITLFPCILFKLATCLLRIGVTFGFCNPRTVFEL